MWFWDEVMFFIFASSTNRISSGPGGGPVMVQTIKLWYRELGCGLGMCRGRSGAEFKVCVAVVGWMGEDGILSSWCEVLRLDCEGHCSC